MSHDKRPLPPKREVIAKAWCNAKGKRALGLHGKTSVAWLATSCWACLAEDHPTERAHIHAHADGGPNEPENYLLLCKRCHKEQPDSASREVQLSWCRNREAFEDWFRRLAEGAVRQLQQMGSAEEIAAWFRHRDLALLDSETAEGFEHSRPQTVANLQASAAEGFRKWKAGEVPSLKPALRGGGEAALTLNRIRKLVFDALGEDGLKEEE